MAGPPVADAGSDQIIIKDKPTSASVSLDASDSEDPDGDPITFDWYGPFTDTSGQFPMVKFPEGVYTVSLTVSDGNSDSDMDTATIAVIPCFDIAARAKSGKVQLTWTHIGGTEHYDVFRSDESDPSNFTKLGETTSTYSTYLDLTVQNETTYLYAVGRLLDDAWCYSNVIASHPTAVRTRGSVNYDPVMYTDPILHGTVGIIYNYDVNAADPNVSDILTYALEMGPSGMTIDPSTGLIEWTPDSSQVGSHEVVVPVIDGNGGMDRQAFIVEVASAMEPLPPEVEAIANPESGGVPLTVAFSAVASDDGTIVLYEWDFDGDGTFDYSSATSGNTSHTYTEVGIYTATLRVTDNDGRTDTDSVSISVIEPPVDCDDEDPCTIDTVDPGTGQCSNDPVECPESDNPCLRPVCEPGADGSPECNYVALTGIACTSPCFESGICNESGVCEPGPPIVCDQDDNPCTTSVCNPTTGVCEDAFVNGTPCDDGDLCTDSGVCENGQCTAGEPIDCSALSDQCNIGKCNPANGECVAQPLDGNSCDDGDACTQNDVCSEGECAAGSPILCDDDNPCTIDTCDSSTGECQSQMDPNAVEVCDGLDNDCDGEIDEGVMSTFFADIDQDDFGDPASSTDACAAPEGFVANDQDCDDSDPAIHPGATEIADNGIDEDCDGVDLISQYGEVWFVDGGAPPGGDGFSWDTAFDQIETAIDAASENDEIWVKAGDYQLTETISIDKVVHLLGGFAGNEWNRDQRDWENNATIISGELFKGTGFMITADATLSGFTIANFWSIFIGGPAHLYEPQAGGVTIKNAAPTISHCTFIDNRGEHAGAIYMESDFPETDISPTIRDCTFRENGGPGSGAIKNQFCSPMISRCVFFGNTGSYGIIRDTGSSAVITDCIFEGNHAEVNNYPILYSSDGSPTISDCNFTGNVGRAMEFGYGTADSASEVENCSFVGNNPVALFVGQSRLSDLPPIISNSHFYANHGRSFYENYGSAISVEVAAANVTGCLVERNAPNMSAAVYIDQSTVEIIDSIFKDNTGLRNGGAIMNKEDSEVNILNSLFSGNVVECTYNRTCGGGAIFNEESSPLIVNSTFAGNRTQYRLGEYVLDGGAINNTNTSIPTIINSVFWDNGPRDIWDAASWVLDPSATVTHSIIGFYHPSLEEAANHNVEEAPSFVDMARENYQLVASSPAVDAGTITVPDPPGLPVLDISGNGRIIDGDEDGTALPDMGAYEYIPGTNIDPPAPPPSNKAPVAKADANLIDGYNVKDYRDFQEHHVGDTIQLDGGGSSDANGDPLSYHWALVQIPTRSAAVLSDPHNVAPTFLIDANGVYFLELVVNDGLTDSAPDYLTIYTQNRRPIADQAPDITVNVGEVVQLSTEYISDPDDDPLTYAWRFASGWPYDELPGKPIGSNVTLDYLRGPNPTFTPDVPGVYSILVSPCDGYGLGYDFISQCNRRSYINDYQRCDYVRVYAQVSNNTPPEITSTPPTVTTTIGGFYWYNFTFEDPDDASVYFVLDVAPAGMYIDHYNPTHLRWEPTADQLGDHQVVIRAIDYRGSYSFHAFTITVTNEPPEIVSTPVTVATDGVPYTYQLEWTDPDDNTTLPELIEAPSGMWIDGLGLIRWTPSSYHVGDQNVTVRVEDLGGLYDTQSFTITVRGNQPPMIISSAQTTATEGMIYIYPVQAIDESETLAFSLETSPTGMEIDSAGGSISWFPESADVGDHDVVVNVTDSMGLTSSQAFTLTVQELEDSDHDNDGYSVNEGDCHDGDPAIHPDAFDVAANGIDENCDLLDANTSIQLLSGQEAVTFPPNSPQHLGYMIAFRSAEPNPYHIQFAHTVEPDNGTLVFDTAFPSEVTTNGTKSWAVNATASGSALGTYEINLRVTVVETGQQDEFKTVVTVASDEIAPVLHPLGTYPDAISMGQTADVRFSSILTGTTMLPTEVILEQLDASDNPIRTLGSLVDDGSSGDLQAGDYVYSGTFAIGSGTEGSLRFRVRSIFPGLTDPVYSEVCQLYVTRFPTELKVFENSTIAQDPISGAPLFTDRVLVTFVAGTPPETIEAIAESIGGQVAGTLLSLGVYQVAITDTGDVAGVMAAMEALEAYPEVDIVEMALLGIPTGVYPDDPYYDAYQEALYHIRADEAWVMSRGGPVIAVIDSGVDYNHPDLVGKVIKGRNFVADVAGNPNWDPCEVMDSEGHGTQVAGVAAATSDNGIGITGVSWKSPILAIKANKSFGAINRPLIQYEATVSGIRYAAAEGAKIINLSVGFDKDFFRDADGYPHPDAKIALRKAVQYAKRKGALVVAAAGNNNTSGRDYPSVFEEVLSVGAVMGDPETGDVTRWVEPDNRAGSNFGPYVDIAAPGKDIYTTHPMATCPPSAMQPDGCYRTNSGTSLAAPMVSGAAALVWASNPQWTAPQVKQRLEQTAIPLPGERLGAGMVDLFEALFNGSFETGDLQGWTSSSWTGVTADRPPWGVPVAHATRSLGPLNPPLAQYYDPTPRGNANDWMAYIDNSGPYVSGAMIRQTFYVQPGVESTQFSFEGYFVTEEFPEWYDLGIFCYDDMVDVTIYGPSGLSSTYFKMEWVSSFPYSHYYQATDIDIGDPGLTEHAYDVTYPQCGYFYDNEYVGVVRFFERDREIFFHEGPGEYTIEISITDHAWDISEVIVDSAILIDNIRFR